jgi:hypothetical protein
MENNETLDTQRAENTNPSETELTPTGVSLQEEEKTQFPPELTDEFRQIHSDEQRQNLYQVVLKMSTPEKIRLAIFGNREARNMLIRHPNKAVSLSVLRNPKITDDEILQYAQQKTLSEEIVIAIAKDKKWTRNYSVKLALALNPKTPLPVAISFLTHFHDNDLKKLSRDKNISSVLSRAAHQGQLKRK